MKTRHQERTNRAGGLALLAGTVLLLAASAQASTAGGAAGTGLAIAVQNALTPTLLGAGHRDVSIPKKAVVRSPFKPPDETSFRPPAWGPPAWANGKPKAVILTDAPWKNALKAAKAGKIRS
jgi:hypothetical protein